MLKCGESQALSKPSDKHKIYVEKLLTLYFGICYKISIDFYITKHIQFEFMFGDAEWAMNPPTPEIYITSEENAYGILWKNWINGEELKFPINYVTDNDFILKTENTYYLEETTACTKKHTFNRCVSKAILDANYKIKRTYANVCKNPCLPFSLPWTPQNKGKLTTNTSNSGGDDSKTSVDEIQKNTGAATNAENENSKQTSSSKQTNSGSGVDNSDTSVADESQKNTGTTKNTEDENSGQTSSDQRDSGRSHRNKREINSNGTLQGVFS